jgi:hypothetical protein
VSVVGNFDSLVRRPLRRPTTVADTGSLEPAGGLELALLRARLHSPDSSTAKTSRLAAALL